MKNIRFLGLALCLALTAFAACDILNDDMSSPVQNGSSSSVTESVVDSSSAEENESSAPLDSSTESSSADEEEKEIYCTVQFDTDGGDKVAAQTVLRGEKITQPETPNYITKECEYVFVGWFYNGAEWDFENDVVTENITLVAEWKEGEKYTEPILPKD